MKTKNKKPELYYAIFGEIKILSNNLVGKLIFKALRIQQCCKY